MKHTPGPLFVNYDHKPYGVGPKRVDPTSRLNLPLGHVFRCHVKGHLSEQKANARLIAASYNSYDKHCGKRAVKCAESDLLGELLEACKAALNELTDIHRANPDEPISLAVINQLEAALAKGI